MLYNKNKCFEIYQMIEDYCCSATTSFICRNVFAMLTKYLFKYRVAVHVLCGRTYIWSGHTFISAAVHVYTAD